MFLLDLLFGKRNKERATVEPVAATAAPVAEPEAMAPGTRIHYSAELVDKLKGDHRKLLELFLGVKAAGEAGDMAMAAARLEDFRAELQGHLLTENIRLYVYLEHALAHDADSHGLMRSFRHEMDEIGKAVVGFLSKYRELASNPVLATTFVPDLEAVGKVLVERIRREEDTLYPLYMPTL